MLDKMIKLYQNPKRRHNFAQNEAVYDQFLAGDVSTAFLSDTHLTSLE